MAAGGLDATMVTGLRLPPFMATLATMLAAKAAALSLSNNPTVPVESSSDFHALGMNEVANLLPWTIIVSTGIVFLAWIIVERTSLGRTILAVGGMPRPRTRWT